MSAFFNNLAWGHRIFFGGSLRRGGGDSATELAGGAEGDGFGLGHGCSPLGGDRKGPLARSFWFFALFLFY